MDRKKTPEELNIKIFAAHHPDRDTEIIDKPPYIPIRCGAVFDHQKDERMAGDDTGDNISEKYGSYGELTALYWMWKNADADYYGLCHDYRYFSFGEEQEADRYANVARDYLSEENLKAFRIEDTRHIADTVSRYDVLVTSPLDLAGVPEKYESLSSQFDRVPTMHREDLETALALLNEMYPQYSEEALEYFQGTRYPPCQMFIMKKELFRDYCEWLFGLLFELEKRLDRTNYCREELRGISYIAERLLGLFIRHRRKQTPRLRVKELQAAAFYRPRPVRPVYPSKTWKNIPVVFASSDYYVPYLAVTIWSMLSNADASCHYDLIVLTGDMGETMEKKLRKMLEHFSNCTLRIMDVTPYVRDKRFVVNGEHVSKETFYRLLAPELFRNFDKIVYLDSDLIVRGDVSQLYGTSMGDSLVAAAVDCDFVGEYNGGIEKVREYCDETLKLKDPYAYFQAGVLVLNIREMRRTFSEGELVDFAQKGSYMYVDQDILNVKCAGRVRYLPTRWNVMTDCAGLRVKYLIQRSPERIYLDYMEARVAPEIIHYAGVEKPWNDPLSDFAEVFWHYARQTPFHELILSRMNEEAKSGEKADIAALKTSINELQAQIDDLRALTEKKGKKRGLGALFPNKNK